MNSDKSDVAAGQAVYTRRTLSIYDFVVLTVSNPFLWKCPTRRLEQHYNRHLSANHLDAGVGTGYFLDRCQFPSSTPRVALMDMNDDALAHASQRIARYQPELYKRNVLEPIAFNAARFDSVGINYLLHCMPGSLKSKAVAFDHLKMLMNPGAVLFGSTLLHDDVQRNWAARQLMRIYNVKGIFSNQKDTLKDLEQALAARFTQVSIEVVGCAAIFAARAD